MFVIKVSPLFCVIQWLDVEVELSFVASYKRSWIAQEQEGGSLGAGSIDARDAVQRSVLLRLLQLSQTQLHPASAGGP
jgi:hypothetical protein